MFKWLPKSKKPTEMLYFLTEHVLIVMYNYERFSEKSFENDSEHFVSDSIFKRLKFDYSSSKTVSNQRTKLRVIFLVTVYLWTCLVYGLYKSITSKFCQFDIAVKLVKVNQGQSIIYAL